MGLFKTIRKKAEVGLVYLGSAIVGRLSRKAVLRLARTIGSIGYAVSGHNRRIGLTNLDIAFGNTRSPEEKKKILKKSFQHFSLVMLDIFWFSNDTRNRIHQYIRQEKDPATIYDNQSHLCLTGHLGNWEIHGCSVSMDVRPVQSVATPLKNPAVDQVLNKLRTVTGQIIIPRKGAVRALLQSLRSNGIVALLLDQNTRVAEGGVFVDFFGLPATVSAAAAALALRTNAVILFGFCIPQPDGTYLVQYPYKFKPDPVNEGDRKAAELQLTQRITSVYEEVIRLHPECWLWMYKRWKHVKPGDDVQRYPFYTTKPQYPTPTGL